MIYESSLILCHKLSLNFRSYTIDFIVEVYWLTLYFFYFNRISHDQINLIFLYYIWTVAFINYILESATPVGENMKRENLFIFCIQQVQSQFNSIFRPRNSPVFINV